MTEGRRPLAPTGGGDWFVGIILWAVREAKPIRLWTRGDAAGSANKGTRASLAGCGAYLARAGELTVRSVGL